MLYRRKISSFRVFHFLLGCSFPYLITWGLLVVMDESVRTRPGFYIFIIRMFCQEQVLHCKCRNHGCSSAEGMSSTTNSGTKAAVLLGMNRCSSFPLLSAPHSPFSISTDLKRYEKIPGSPAWRWGEWIWLTGPSGLHRNSPQGLNISSIRVFDQIRDMETPITLCPLIYYHQLFCKLRNQGHSSAQWQVFPHKLRNPGCSFTRDG